MITINSDMMSRPETDAHYLQVRRELSNEYTDVSVVVLAYGRPEKTKVCIENIIEHTNLEYELILVDNGTEENDLVEYFETVDFPRKELIKFTKNITTVYAMNKVTHMLGAKYIVWINNDIIVTEKWLENLLTCAESDETIGIVCPVSTNVSNLQSETLGGFTNLEEMQEKAAAFNRSDPSKWEERIRMIPTATLFRREIFDAVGMYDLGFMHDFGDDDLSFRVRRAGYKLMVCKDTFVHHDHDQKNLPQERLEIIKNSRTFFREKFHGVDAWDDTCNFVMHALDYVKFEDNSKKDILGLDVRCGTPLLEIKNHLRKNHIDTNYCKAYTTEAKYLPDLESVSDAVVCGDVEQTIKCEYEKYDVIVLGKPLNYYKEPIELIVKLAHIKKNDGYIVFSVKNTNSILSFLNMMGMKAQTDESHPREMYYNDVYAELCKYGITRGELVYKTHNVTQDLKEKVVEVHKVMNLGSNPDFVLQHLLVDEYMITVC